MHHYGAKITTFKNRTIFHVNKKYKVTFQSKNSRIRIHESRIGSNRPPQRLRWHAHINNHNTVLWCSLPNTYILLWFHGNIRKGNELCIDPNTRQLQHQIKQTSHNTNHKAELVFTHNNSHQSINLATQLNYTHATDLIRTTPNRSKTTIKHEINITNTRNNPNHESINQTQHSNNKNRYKTCMYESN